MSKEAEAWTAADYVGYGLVVAGIALLAYALIGNASAAEEAASLSSDGTAVVATMGVSAMGGGGTLLFILDKIDRIASKFSDGLAENFANSIKDLETNLVSAGDRLTDRFTNTVKDMQGQIDHNKDELRATKEQLRATQEQMRTLERQMRALRDSHAA